MHSSLFQPRQRTTHMPVKRSQKDNLHVAEQSLQTPQSNPTKRIHRSRKEKQIDRKKSHKLVEEPLLTWQKYPESLRIAYAELCAEYEKTLKHHQKMNYPCHGCVQNQCINELAWTIQDFWADNEWQCDESE